MSLTDDVAALRARFAASWTACPAYGPREEPVALVPSGDPAAPSYYLAWVVTDEATEGSSVGTRWTRRAVTVWVWGLRDSDPVVLGGVLDTAEAFVKATAISGLTWLDEELREEWREVDAYGGTGVSIPYLKAETTT